MKSAIDYRRSSSKFAETQRWDGLRRWSICQQQPGDDLRGPRPWGGVAGAGGAAASDGVGARLRVLSLLSGGVWRRRRAGGTSPGAARPPVGPPPALGRAAHAVLSAVSGSLLRPGTAAVAPASGALRRAQPPAAGARLPRPATHLPFLWLQSRSKMIFFINIKNHKGKIKGLKFLPQFSWYSSPHLLLLFFNKIGGHKD